MCSLLNHSHTMRSHPSNYKDYVSSLRSWDDGQWVRLNIEMGGAEESMKSSETEWLAIYYLTQWHVNQFIILLMCFSFRISGCYALSQLKWIHSSFLFKRSNSESFYLSCCFYVVLVQHSGCSFQFLCIICTHGFWQQSWLWLGTCRVSKSSG